MTTFRCDIWPDSHADAERLAHERCAEYFGDTPYRIIAVDVTTMHDGFDGSVMVYEGRVRAESIAFSERVQFDPEFM